MSSTATLTQQETLTTTLPQTANEMEEVTCSLPGSSQSYDQKTLKRSSTLNSDKDKITEKDDAKSTSSQISRRLSNVSTASMTHVRTSSEIGSKSDPVKYPNYTFKHYCTNYIKPKYTVFCFI